MVMFIFVPSTLIHTWEYMIDICSRGDERKNWREAQLSEVILRIVLVAEPHVG